MPIRIEEAVACVICPAGGFPEAVKAFPTFALLEKAVPQR
jgi:hypothetical protein